MADISARDRRAAQAWMVKMLDDPVRHGAAFKEWAAARPGRLDYYERLLDSVQQASRAARLFPVRNTIDNRQSRRPPRTLALSLTLIAITGLIAVIGWRFTPEMLQPRQAIPIAGRTLHTQIGEVRTEKLADGSTVILDTNSEIAAQLEETQRFIELKRGRARFIVAHDSTRPFIVAAAGNQVIATGTIFDVTLRNGFGVHLLQGGIEVRFSKPPSEPREVRSLILRPGQQIRFFDGQATIPLAMPARKFEEQWVTGVKSFDDAAIKDVISEANSYGATQIVLADPVLGDREIFGDINIRDTQAVARAVANYLDLRIDRSEPGKLILIGEK